VTSRHVQHSLQSVGDTLIQRIARFNEELAVVRMEIMKQRGSEPWRDKMHNRTIHVVWGADDDYMTQLKNFSHVTTVALRWFGDRTTWTKRKSDLSNLHLQQYYDWTAEDKLCNAVESTTATNRRYDAIFNRTCTRNITADVEPTFLKPVYLNGKPIDKGRQYWPNDGNSYPTHFYTEPPPFVFYLHILTNAIVTDNGFVFSKNLKLVLYSCVPDFDKTLPNGGNLESISVYDELFVISQLWGKEVYHRMIDIMPRIVLFLDFLKANPQIRILAPETSGGRLGELFRIVGLAESRLVSGVTRAKIVYLPRAVGCGFPNVQETQILSAKYNDYIRKTFPAQPRNRLLLISRASRPNRQFTEYNAIEEAAKRVARDFNLTFTVFSDNPLPSLNETMLLFHSAVLVVGSSGAGLSNIVFSQPGTLVLEGVCMPMEVNLCFAYLAHILGQRYHGLSSTGAIDVINVSVKSVESAMREQLSIWRRVHSSH